MTSEHLSKMNHCIVDDPLEFTSAEIATLHQSIGRLLRIAPLCGALQEMEPVCQAIFDTGAEIGSAECSAYISGNQSLNNFEVVACRNLDPPLDRTTEFFAPAALASHFGKVIHLDSEKDPGLLPVCKVWQSASLVAFPLRLGHETAGTLVFGRKNGQPFSLLEIKLLSALASQAEFFLVHSESMRAITYYSHMDPLTHLQNRQYFNDQLEREIFRSRRNGNPLSLVVIDVDEFQSYNTACLPASGDIVLQELAAILQSTAREVDIVARIGGDEFAVVLLESNAYGGHDFAQRVINQFRSHLFPGAEQSRTKQLSVSVGVATFPSDSFNKLDLLEKADRALRHAKSLGGGKVALYQEIPDLLSLHPSQEELPIQKIFRAASSVVDMDKFLEILLFTAMKGLDAERGSIVVPDPNGNFFLRAAIGFSMHDEGISSGSPITPGAITKWVLEHQESLVVGKGNDLPPPLTMKKNGYVSNSFLSLPLKDDGQLIGVLHLTNRKDKKPFTREHLESFEPIAKQIASILSQGVKFRENFKHFSTLIFDSLSSALELRFPFLEGHSKRVQDLCFRIGKRLGLGQDELVSLDIAAAVHDIGNLGVPGMILSKPRKLTDRELEVARNHPFFGYRFLEGIPGLEETRRYVLEHHEFCNGTGYPSGLHREEISQGARILGLVEFYDSITSERPHRGGLHQEEAIQLIRNNRSTLFDETICDAFLAETGAPGTA